MPKSSAYAIAPTGQISEHWPHEGPVLETVKGFDVIECASCGFRHVLPLPSPLDAGAAYNEDYYGLEKPDYLDRAVADAPWAGLFYEDRIDALLTALGAGNAANMRLLDIGSGPGHFLKAAAEAGFSALGIEPSHQAVTFARASGLVVDQGLFSAEWVTRQTSFDAIHCMNMLEHVPNPASILQAAFSALRRKGAICIGVPNDYSPFQRAARENGTPAWWLTPPHHLNYFDFDSLEGLLGRVGFQPVTRLTSFPMELFLLMGRNYIGNDTTGRALHTERKSFDTLLEVGVPGMRRKLYRALAELGLGREAIVVAIKP